jgi:ferritin
MLQDKIQDALNEQINAEFYSAYLYLAMSAWCEQNDLAGMAHWFQIQAQEEAAHAMKFFGYVVNRSGRVVLGTVEAPPNDWESPIHVFKHTLVHEQEVTARVNKLVDVARDSGDHQTEALLHWFVSEQVEEEATASSIVGKLKLAGDGGGLFMIDEQLAQRVFTPPAAA